MFGDVEAAAAGLFDEEVAGDGELEGDGADGSLAASNHGRNDREMPAGGALHGGETRGGIVKVDDLNDSVGLAASFKADGVGADDANVVDYAGGDFRFVELVEDMARDDALAIDFDGIEIVEAEIAEGLELSEGAWIAHDFELVGFEFALEGPGSG